MITSCIVGDLVGKPHMYFFWKWLTILWISVYFNSKFQAFRREVFYGEFASQKAGNGESFSMSWLLREITYHHFPVEIVEIAAVDNDAVEGRDSVDASGMEQLSSSEKTSGSRIKEFELLIRCVNAFYRKLRIVMTRQRCRHLWARRSSLGRLLVPSETKESAPWQLSVFSVGRSKFPRHYIRISRVIAHAITSAINVDW